MVRNIVLLSGRFLDEGDVQNAPSRCDAHRKLAVRFTAIRAERRRPGDQAVRVAVFGDRHVQREDETFGQSEMERDTVLIPITVLQLFHPGGAHRPAVCAGARAGDVEAADGRVQTAPGSRHRAGARYGVDTLTAILEAAQSIALILSLVLVLVSAIALIISGIGIMNIMLVTVTERTREIGVRMAVGASRRAVLEQFLTESVALSMAGGVIGILVGISIPLSVRFITDAIRVPISTMSIFVAFGVSLAVGVIFGMLPANRASQLNPTEALRYE